MKIITILTTILFIPLFYISESYEVIFSLLSNSTSITNINSWLLSVPFHLIGSFFDVLFNTFSNCLNTIYCTGAAAGALAKTAQVASISTATIIASRAALDVYNYFTQDDKKEDKKEDKKDENKDENKDKEESAGSSASDSSSSQSTSTSQSSTTSQTSSNSINSEPSIVSGKPSVNDSTQSNII